MDLTSASTQDETIASIMAMEYMRGATYTHVGLTMAHEQVIHRNFSREGMPR